MSQAINNDTTPTPKPRRVPMRSQGKSRADAPVIAPPMPPLTAEEQSSRNETMRIMKEMTLFLRQRNLNNAVQLAIQASKGQGPLVDHFCELGRRFGEELTKIKPPAPKLTLRVIEGGHTLDSR